MSNRVGLADPINFERFCMQWQDSALREAEAWTQDPELQLLLSEAVLGDFRRTYADKAPSDHMDYFIKGQTCLVFSKTGHSKAQLEEYINAQKEPGDPGPYRMTPAESEKIRQPNQQAKTSAGTKRRRPAQTADEAGNEKPKANQVQTGKTASYSGKTVKAAPKVPDHTPDMPETSFLSDDDEFDSMQDSGIQYASESVQPVYQAAPHTLVMQQPFQEATQTPVMQPPFQAAPQAPVEQPIYWEAPQTPMEQPPFQAAPQIPAEQQPFQEVPQTPVMQVSFQAAPQAPVAQQPFQAAPQTPVAQQPFQAAPQAPVTQVPQAPAVQAPLVQHVPQAQGQAVQVQTAVNTGKPDTFYDPNRSTLWLPKSLSETEHVIQHMDLPDEEVPDNRSMFLSLANTALFIVAFVAIGFFIYSTGIIQHFFF